MSPCLPPLTTLPPSSSDPTSKGGLDCGHTFPHEAGLATSAEISSGPLFAQKGGKLYQSSRNVVHLLYLGPFFVKMKDSESVSREGRYNRSWHFLWHDKGTAILRLSLSTITHNHADTTSCIRERSPP